MMLCLALRSSPEQVYQRARRQFTDDEISEGFAAAHGLALPSQLRQMIRDAGPRPARRVPARCCPHRPRPIRIQRWSARRVGLLLLTVPAGRAAGQGLGLRAGQQRPHHHPAADRQAWTAAEPEPLWLQAQSVPSASLVPCVELAASGWRLPAPTSETAGRIHPRPRPGRQPGARRAAHRDLRHQPARPRCHPSGQGCGTTSGPSATTDRFAATWYDQFPGGCVTSRLRLNDRHRRHLRHPGPTRPRVHHPPGPPTGPRRAFQRATAPRPASFEMTSTAGLDKQTSHWMPTRARPTDLPSRLVERRSKERRTSSDLPIMSRFPTVYSSDTSSSQKAPDRSSVLGWND